MEPLLEIVHLRKRYGTFEALKDISLSVGRGEIVALLGANGSGKSTLLHILSGHAVIDETGGYEGEVRLAGRCLALRSSRDALAAGIGMVHQELSLLPGLSVADNIFLSRERTEFSLPAPLSLLSWVDRSAQRRDGAQALASLGIVADVDRAVRSVSLPLRFLVEFAREKARDDLRLLLLDEPTSGLNRHESATMLQAVRELAARGVGVLFVSHKIHEALELCHRILVLKDGVLAAEFSRKDFRYGGVVRAMFGNDLASSSDEAVERRRSDDGPSVLEFRNLETRSADEDLTGFSLDVRRGEIVGITSLLGQGKGAFTRFFADEALRFSGELRVLGKSVARHDPFFRRKVVFLSEDRKRDSLLAGRSVLENLTFPAYTMHDRFRRGGFLRLFDRKAAERSAQEAVERYHIQCASIHQPVSELSGGNQQKVAVAKAAGLAPEVLVVCEPTRGIDVRAKRSILDWLRQLNRQDGIAIVVCSGEPEDLVGICDRIVVLRNGRVHRTLGPEADEAALLNALESEETGV